MVVGSFNLASTSLINSVDPEYPERICRGGNHCPAAYDSSRDGKPTRTDVAGANGQLYEVPKH